uniref:Uncharacterized protein n=1 Tax=Amphiprion percula TaxID=161767 RepID=A0A3P8TPX0_AMPPE
MSSSGYIRYHGLLLPPIAHTMDSLEFAQNFAVEDSDVFAVTYPKSGIVHLFSVYFVATEPSNNPLSALYRLVLFLC